MQKQLQVRLHVLAGNYWRRRGNYMGRGGELLGGTTSRSYGSTFLMLRLRVRPTRVSDISCAAAIISSQR